MLLKQRLLSSSAAWLCGQCLLDVFLFFNGGGIIVLYSLEFKTLEIRQCKTVGGRGKVCPHGDVVTQLLEATCCSVGLFPGLSPG